MARPLMPLLVLASLLVLCVVGQSAPPAFTSLVVQLDDTLDPSTSPQGERLVELLQSVLPATVVASSESIDYSSLPKGTLVVSFGDCWQSNQLISPVLLSGLGSEGYCVQSAAYRNGTVHAIAANGNAASSSAYAQYANGGLLHASFALLEELGFGFFHPLQPLIPDSLALYGEEVSIATAPHWPLRGWHYHTEHPLELTEVLNGMESNGTAWEDMLDEVDLFAQWLCANGQNEIEWVLLWQPSWDEFAWSDLRQDRLSILVDIFHGWAVNVGADVPIAEVQQHAWYMTTNRGEDLRDNAADIKKHVDWLMACNYDYISTESGYSEFTHPDCTLMLEWMNITTAYLMDNYDQKRIFIKCHCSTGQYCQEFANPLTGEPIDFNFLPAFADPRLGVYPHTVQVYTFFQPAPTYGNQNFTYMLEFMFAEAGKRDVVFQGETAYWVNYDIDVPLFLPIYGANRILDLQTMARLEQVRNVSVQGQNNFGSGWEWSYWLHDVATARAAWDPQPNANSTEEVVAHGFMPVARAFGADVAEDFMDVLLRVIGAEEDLLVYGNWNGTRPSDVTKRNGIAYLEGWDTWSQLESIVDVEGATQPAKLMFHEMRDPVHIFGAPPPDYETEIQPLLNAMQQNFTQLTAEMAALRDRVNPAALFLFNEIVDTMNITALRATNVYSLYQYVWGFLHESPRTREEQAAAAYEAIVAAQEVVTRRESQYRVPVSRIAGWRSNPTAYEFGYLWTVHSLYYFWRDYSQATDVSPETGIPCFMNVINPVDIGFGEGPLLTATTALAEWLEYENHYGIGQCLIAPAEEPEYPLTPIITEEL